MATRGNLRMTKAPATAQKLFTLGTQYEVRESDGTWVKGTVTKVLAKRITVAFDKIYPVTVFDKEEIQRDVEQLLESNEFRWVDTKLSKKVLKKSEKEVVETLSSLTGATFQKHFPGYGLWKGTVASYVHEKLAFECVYEDGYKEYNSLKQLLKYNVSKKYRIPKSMLQKLLGEKQTPNEKIHK